MPSKTEPSRSEQMTKSTDKPAKAAGSATEGARESRGRVADTEPVETAARQEQA